VREAATRFRVGKTTASRALEELQEKGFIVCTTKGGFAGMQDFSVLPR
jgi:DNA-binding transcriptional regulator YhcF (GntR family)